MCASAPCEECARRPPLAREPCPMTTTAADRGPDQDDDYAAWRALPRSIRVAREALRLFRRGELEAALVRLQDLATWQIAADLARAANSAPIAMPEYRSGEMDLATEIVAEAIRKGDRV